MSTFDDYPCHKLPRSQWCDHDGPGGFMGHTCVKQYKPTGTALTDREREVLIILMEECAEVVQAASKLLRFGKEKHPVTKIQNTETLSIECGDLQCMLSMANELGLTDAKMKSDAAMNKAHKLRTYMQTKP